MQLAITASKKLVTYMKYCTYNNDAYNTAKGVINPQCMNHLLDLLASSGAFSEMLDCMDGITLP